MSIDLIRRDPKTGVLVETRFPVFTSSLPTSTILFDLRVSVNYVSLVTILFQSCVFL